MRFVYARRPLTQLEFASASQREAIPEDAEVFAVCDGAMTIRQHDEQSFRKLTEQEQIALEEAIVVSQRSETDLRRSLRPGFLRHLLRQLTF